MTGNGRTIKRAKVNFLRRLTKNELSDVEIVDGNFIVTKDGGLYTDFEGKRVELIQSLKADEIFPINKVEIFYDNLDHSDYLGYSWELISQGRVPVGLDVNDTDFNEIGKLGGEKKHKLTVDEMPAHTHGISTMGGSELASGYSYVNGGGYNNAFTQATGGNQPHNNMQPYIVMAFWRRVA